MDKNIIQDEDKNNIVVIDYIKFHGRQNIAWEEVEQYLKHIYRQRFSE